MASKSKFYLSILGIMIIFLVVLIVAKGLYFSAKTIKSEQSEITPPLTQTATSGEEVYTNASGHKWTLPAKADFTVSTPPGAPITFLEGKIEPLKVHPGDIQHMRIVVI